MAELKRNFLKARMNKDLDERLVPNGEYRDALNVQITTSDDSNVGSVQTLHKNIIWQGLDDNYRHGPFRPHAVCDQENLSQTIGVFKDEENNHIYNFVANDTYLQNENLGNNLNGLLGVKSDAIYQIKPDKINPGATKTKLLIRDIYEVRIAPKALGVNNRKILVSIPANNIQWSRLQGSPSFNSFSGIRPGMRVQAIDLAGNDVYGPQNKIFVKKIYEDDLPGYFNIVCTEIFDQEGLYTDAMQAAGVVLKFTSERILKFQTGSSYELEQNTEYPLTTKTPTNSYITAINVIDDFLFWTDGRNEPKKISIKRSLAGNPNSLAPAHTLLVIEKNKKLYAKDYLREEHVTVLKPNPDLSLRAIPRGSSGSDLVEVLFWAAQNNQITDDTNFVPWSFTNSSNEFYGPNTDIYVQPQIQLGQPFEINQIIELTGQNSATTVNVKIVDVNGDNPGPNGGYYTINRVDDFTLENENSAVNYSPNEPDENWFARAINKDEMYTKDFVRFSYRYIYTDNEISAFAPFSPAAFIAGDYSYQAKDGYNIGMLNRADSIEIFDYIHDHTPKDVVKIQLIFKSQRSENMYLFKTIDINEGNTSDGILREVKYFRSSPAFNWDTTKFTIKEKVFGFTLPSDQQTRVFDAVPKKAVAQEIQANRLMYGNYTQDYDLFDASNNIIDPDIKTKIRQNSYENSSNTVESPNIFSAFTDHRDYIASSGSGTLDDPFVFSNTPWNSLTIQNEGTNLGGQYFTSVNLQMSGEFDPGDNFDSFQPSTEADLLTGTQGNSIYTVPMSGYYTIEASARVVGTFQTPLTVDGVSRRTTRLVVLPVYNGEVGTSAGQQGTNLGGATAYSIGFDQFGGVGYEDCVASPWVSESTILGSLENLDDASNYFHIVMEGEDADLGGGVVGAPVQVWDPGDDDDSWILTIPPTTVYLHKGEVGDFNNANSFGFIGLFVQCEQGHPNTVTVTDVNFSITAAPSETIGIGGSLKGERSVKALRNYNLGVVYRDRLGRESSVLIGKENDFSLGKALSKQHNSLVARARNNAPKWAETYKFFIKENTSKFQNLVLEAAFASEGENYIYLVFNSVDVNKVKAGDYLIGKKRHNTNSYVSDDTAKWRVVSIIGDVDSDGTVGGDVVPNAVSVAEDELEGKFFVKVRNINLVGNENILGPLSVPVGAEEGTPIYTAADSNNGAVFEVEPDTQIDLDLYYEASDSYAIKLDRRNATKHIRPGMRVSFPYNNLGPGSNLRFGANNNPKIVRVIGALTDGISQTESQCEDASCQLILDSVSNTFLSATVNGFICRIYNDEFGFKNTRDYVEARLFGGVVNGSAIIKLKPIVHAVPGNDPEVEIGLPWYNCFSFGNGVESDTIRDDFNGTELFSYIAAGKQSGFKANMPSENYGEYTYLSKIIFSQIYNENIGSNRFNQFLMSENIVKELNSDYGSIQKLYSRNNDLLALCERKCLKILSKKDALFNADGKSQLLATDKVLGQAIPFVGDYGISKNPESFAVDEYRCYFTDKQRSAVIRLSNDGITAISDYGMKDWFKDQMINSDVIIGSFDSQKEEYNITLHEVLYPNNFKNVYTLSFNETVDGWTSFKSYIQEAGITLNNVYYTFKNSIMHRHGEMAYTKYILDSEDYLENSKPFFNTFYGKTYTSSITTLFNDIVSTVKTFRTIKYEGTQAQIVEFNEVEQDDVVYTDGEYYNLTGKFGWFVESINTDLQDAQAKEFKEKEGKWFSYIKGNETAHINLIDGGTSETTNIDVSEFSVQGLGLMNGPVTLIDGELPDTGFFVTVDAEVSYESESDDV